MLGLRPTSDLIAAVGNLQLELPSLETHQCMPEFVSGELLPIDRNERQAALGGIVPADAPSDGILDDFLTEPAAFYVHHLQGAAHLFHETPTQGKQVVAQIADDLEFVATQRAVAKLEGLQRDDVAEQRDADETRASLRCNRMHELFGR